jgi:hypothetical protein
MIRYNPLLEKWSKTKDCNSVATLVSRYACQSLRLSVATLVSRSFGAFWLHLFEPLRNVGYNHIKAFIYDL